MKHSKGRRQKAEGGFTLLELIIAITILSVVTVIIGSGLRLGIKAWEKGEAEAYETQRLRIISGLLYQHLKSAYPYKVEMDGKKVVAFKGTPESIVFVTTQADLSEGGLKWVSYSFKDGALLFKEGILPDKKFLEKATEALGDGEIIDLNIKEFKLQYLSSEDEEWGDSWESNEALPKAVKVTVTDFQPFLITIPVGFPWEDT